ncbi:unnamed protein product [Rhizophagus irregularis]|nr:unnamed protein product [Rhizophagus irregularis]
MLESEHTALGALQRNVDEYGISTSLADLVKAGFLRNNDRVLNVTETLHKCQIYCCISDPCNPSSKKVITGRCIVLRNPCFHPGDICIVTALKCKDLSHLVDVAEPPEFSLTTSMDMVARGLGLYQDRWSELFGKCWATSIQFKKWTRNSGSQVSFSYRKDHSNNGRYVSSQIAFSRTTKRQKYWSEEARLECYYRTFPRKHRTIGMVDQELTSMERTKSYSRGTKELRAILFALLVFPAVGYRDIPSECSGGDLDGDDFTVIYDERLIPS